mmetsp:Transcript_32957/g.85457  ORF Transcript_32957/g.85457 Transcript_32957/m.85457 type:complete len:411 (-) Transcript_32957:199-1431(-)
MSRLRWSATSAASLAFPRAVSTTASCSSAAATSSCTGPCQVCTLCSAARHSASASANSFVAMNTAASLRVHAMVSGWSFPNCSCFCVIASRYSVTAAWYSPLACSVAADASTSDSPAVVAAPSCGACSAPAASTSAGTEFVLDEPMDPGAVGECSSARSCGGTPTSARAYFSMMAAASSALPCAFREPPNSAAASCAKGWPRPSAARISPSTVRYSSSVPEKSAARSRSFPCRATPPSRVRISDSAARCTPRTPNSSSSAASLKPLLRSATTTHSRATVALKPPPSPASNSAARRSRGSPSAGLPDMVSAAPSLTMASTVRPSRSPKHLWQMPRRRWQCSTHSVSFPGSSLSTLQHLASRSAIRTSCASLPRLLELSMRMTRAHSAHASSSRPCSVTTSATLSRHSTTSS